MEITMFAKGLDALCAGFNGVLFRGEKYRIVGGTGDKILHIRNETTDETIEIHINEVNAFCKF
jgi:hypothetical protein